MPERTDVRRGDVVIVDLGVDNSATLNKRRPAVVIQDDRGNRHAKHTIVVPLSRGEGSYPFHVDLLPRYTGLDDRSHARCAYVTTVCLTEHVKRVLGQVPKWKLGDIEDGLQTTLGMS